MRHGVSHVDMYVLPPNLAIQACALERQQHLQVGTEGDSTTYQRMQKCWVGRKEKKAWMAKMERGDWSRPATCLLRGVAQHQFDGIIVKLVHQVVQEVAASGIHICRQGISRVRLAAIQPTSTQP